MNKQKLTFGLGLISLVLGSVMSFPVKTIAGQAVVQGTTPDSSSTSGDSFAPSIEVTTEINVVAPTVSAAPGSSPENPDLEVTQEAQLSLNIVANNEITRGTSSEAILFNPASANYDETVSDFKQTLTSSGVDNESAQGLIDSLRDTVNNNEVDINGLNKTINIYNQTIKAANANNLQKLSQNQTFKGLGNILKKLRASLNSK